jgi:hypothetical protein
MPSCQVDASARRKREQEGLVLKYIVCKFTSIYVLLSFFDLVQSVVATADWQQEGP